jgi:hypothetical protein
VEQLQYRIPIILDLQMGQIMKDINVIIRELQLIQLNYEERHTHYQITAKFSKENAYE